MAEMPKWKEKMKGNMPGKDNRAQTKPASKARHTGVTLREAVMGRSKGVRTATPRSAILD